MIASATHFLLSTILNILTMMFLLRFVMQVTKTPFFNPIGQIVMALTDFAVKPVRKFIPSWGKLDLSTLLLALMTQLLLQSALFWFRDFPFSVANVPVMPSIIGLSVIGVLRAIVDIFFYAIFLQVILSWVNPHTPIAPIVSAITRPILDPIRKIMPIVNGIDFSPLAALIILQMVNITIMKWIGKASLAIL